MIHRMLDGTNAAEDVGAMERSGCSATAGWRSCSSATPLRSRPPLLRAGRPNNAAARRLRADQSCAACASCVCQRRKARTALHRERAGGHRRHPAARRSPAHMPEAFGVDGEPALADFASALRDGRRSSGWPAAGTQQLTWSCDKRHGGCAAAPGRSAPGPGGAATHAVAQDKVARCAVDLRQLLLLRRGDYAAPSFLHPAPATMEPHKPRRSASQSCFR